MKPSKWQTEKLCGINRKGAAAAFITFSGPQAHGNSVAYAAGTVRMLLFALCCLLAECAPAPVTKVPVDPAADPSYTRIVAQLAAMHREASALVQAKKPDEAGAIVTTAQPLIERLLRVPKPTLEAMQAASDLDQLYGRMLLANRHYGWARMLFQKNIARWKNWNPQTEDTARRTKLAAAAMAECDRAIGQ